MQYADNTTGETKTFSVSTMPPWLVHTGRYTSTGEDFIKWCIVNDAGVEVIEKNGNLFAVNVYGVPVQIEMAPAKTTVSVE